MDVIYKQVANRLAERIRAQEFRPGEKLPSLRTLCKLENISLMTAVAALAQLETLGIVQSKPRSGFVVKPPQKISQPPALDSWGERANAGLREAAIAEVVNAVGDPDHVPLGAGCPSPELFANAELSQLFRHEMRRDPYHSAKYSSAPGDLALRREICHRLNARKCKVDPSQILLTAGGMEALAIALGTLLKPNDRVMVEVPTFFGIHQLLRRLHVEIIEVPSDMQNGIHVESVLEEVQRVRIKAAVLMPNFNNPTGALLATEKKRELVRILSAHDLAIVEDDIYSDLSYDGQSPLPLLAFREKTSAPHYLVSSFSKTIGPGLRIGYIASSDDIFSLSIQKFTTNVGNSRLAEKVTAEVVKSGLYEKQVRKLATVFAQNSQRVRQAIAAHFPAESRIANPQGGFVVWVELPHGIDTMEVYKRSLDKKISIAPGFIFSTHANLNRYVRFNAGTLWTPRIVESIRTVGALATEAGHLL